MKLPKVLFGTSGLGNLYRVLPDDVKFELVSTYVRQCQGGAFFDTAGKYGAGLALESLGVCLKSANVHPDNVIISNKLGWYRTPLTTPEPTFEPGIWKGLKYDAIQKISYEGITRCYEQGNELLGDYPAKYVSVHDPDEYLAAAVTPYDKEKRYREILGAYDALLDLKQKGAVSAIGIGAKDWKIIALIDQDVRLDWVMFANSMTVHSHPKKLLELMDKLKRQGTLIINSAVFNGGFLTGGDFYNYKQVDTDTSWGETLFTWRKKFHHVCATYGVTPAAVSVQFGMAAPGVEHVALSTTNPKRIETNFALANAKIPWELWDTLYYHDLITIDGWNMILKSRVQKPNTENI